MRTAPRQSTIAVQMATVMLTTGERRALMLRALSAAATAWLNRWDGGEGYQSIFLRRGFPVYIWDGPHVGRANWGCTENKYEPGIGRDQGNFTAWRFASGR